MKHIQSVTWLKTLIDEKQQDFTLFDCRYDLMDEDLGELQYRKSHIPGAHYAHLSLNLSSGALPTGEGGRHPLPEPIKFAQFLADHGVSKQSTVVAYDDQGGAMASRLRWLLLWVGHEGDINIIEDGFKGWVEAGYETESQLPQRQSTEAYTVNMQSQMLVDRHYVINHINNEQTVIIDSRDGARYRGEHEPIDKQAGHIPSAVNYVWTGNKDSSGKWLNADALAARFSQLDRDNEIIVYCGSGVTATPNVFALQEAGFKNVKLYAGSWSEWSSNADNPVETGEESVKMG